MPVRLFVAVKRAPGISFEEFHHGYETRHSRFGLRNFGHLWTEYKRTYVTWDHLTVGKAYQLGDPQPVDHNLPFDAITEVVYPDLAAYAEASRIRRTVIGDMIPGDEEASGFHRESSLWLVGTDTIVEDLSTAVAAAGNKNV